MSDYPDDDDDDAEEMPQGEPAEDATGGAQIPASWMWGSSTSLVLRSSGPTDPPIASGQLANVTLPEPAVCSIYFQATIVRRTDPANVVQVFTLNLLEGIGRVTVPRQVSYIAQPAFGSPLEVTLPFVPIHALQVNIEARGSAIGPADELEIVTYFILSPITRIAQKQSELKFGMAVPGEADSLDDEMREELEAEAPTVQQILSAGDDDQVEIVQTPRQRLIERVIGSLTQRLGRRPTKQQVRAALARVDARAARSRFAR
jgi:hypothetical protein